MLGEHPGQAREDFAAYRGLGGYRTLAGVDELLTEVESSGLLGRGGAAFPLAVKLRAVRDNGRLIAGAGGTVVVANGEEGEPASIKDRWLLRNRPHMVLDGLRLAAAIVEANRAYVYVSDQESARSVEAALSELTELNADSLGGVTIDVAMVPPGYVAGEETAAVRSLNGGPAKPTDKPPRPFEEGVGGLPTLVSNVETLANLPYLQRHGSAAFRAQGTSLSPGTFLATITGAGRPSVLYELPHGLPFTELLALHGVSPSDVRGALLGGYFAGFLEPTRAETTPGPRDLPSTRQRAGLRCDLGAHRRLPRRGRGIGAGLLRSRKCRAVRLVFQRDSGDGRRRRGVARRRRDDRGSRPVAPLVGSAPRTRRLRDTGCRHQCGGDPARPVSRRGDTPSRRQLPRLQSRRIPRGASRTRPSGGEVIMKIRLDRTVCDGFGAVRQARTRLLLARRLGIRVPHRRWHRPRRRPRRGRAGTDGLPGARHHRAR